VWVVVSRAQVRARGGPEAGLAEPRLAGTREDDEENGGRKSHERKLSWVVTQEKADASRSSASRLVQGSRRTLNSAGAVCAT
jgi:hypothetical protein